MTYDDDYDDDTCIANIQQTIKSMNVEQVPLKDSL